jgi:hypothetical protein
MPAPARQQGLSSHQHRSNRVVELQPLEARTLLAAAAVPTLSTVATSLGNLLHVRGTSGDDRIAIINTTSGLLIGDGTGWSKLHTGALAQIRVDGGGGNDLVEINANIKTHVILYGGAGSDTLRGGSGNDRVYGGDGRDYLYGNGGDDVIVSLGDASVDRAYGGRGFDSFWADAGADERVLDVATDEIAAGAMHRVERFMDAPVAGTGQRQPVPRTLGATPPNLPDPGVDYGDARYESFASRPLFSKYGPRADDVYQGSIGDCYLLASLGSVANANPQIIRDRIVDLGDGTFAVQFTSGGATAYVRVDAELPVSSGQLVYAKLGRQGSLWVAIVEKAYALFRSAAGSYASLDNGFMADVYDHLGLRNGSLFSASSAQSLLQRLQSDLASGRAVTMGTRGDCGDVPVMGAHAYMVDSVVTDSSGNVTHLRLRNPWGTDDMPGHGADDGYILLTAAQAMRVFWFACSAIVR